MADGNVSTMADEKMEEDFPRRIRKSCVRNNLIAEPTEKNGPPCSIEHVSRRRL